MKLFALIALLFLPAAAFAQEFVPLTGLPGLETLSEAGSGDTLADFFNALYRICIGAAATIAVFNIMYAGFQGMLNEGSITEKGKVRSRIQNSLLGLLLVLSPAIVFGVIDPRILELDLNFESLRPSAAGPFEIFRGSGALTQTERDALAVVTADIARECGISLSAENVACLQQNVGRDSAQCYPTPPTSEQLSCMYQGAQTRAATCESLTIREGTVVPNESAYCCAQAGFAATPNRQGDTERYRCTAPGTQGDTSTTLPAAAGTFNFVLYTGSAEDTCVPVVHGSYPTNEACTAALSQETAARPSHASLYGSQCQQPPLTIRFNTPICPSIVTLP